MRFRKRWLFLLLAVVAALPGFPPLIEWGLERALEGVPGTVSWERVSGYALTGLRLEGVRVEGPGYRARIEELRLGYNLLALVGKKLPLSLELRGGSIELDPGRLEGLNTGGGVGGIEPALQRLVLEDVAISSAAWPRFALPPYRVEISGALPRFSWKLETDEGALAGELELRSAADWSTTFAGDVAVSRYWWDGGQYGRLEGAFGYREGHWLGQARLLDGGVVLAGFPMEQVGGEIVYRDHVITSRLAGRSLDGPVTAEGVVDVPGRHYSFDARGEPRLEALMELWNVHLPAEGRGPLELHGEGWATLDLQARFSGEGRFVGRPLAYSGSFVYDREGFRLDTEAEGAFLERAWRGRFAWRDGGWTSVVTDDKGSRIEARGAGVRYGGSGRLVWPRPLDGAAEVAFAGEGVRWHVGVKSPGVGLLLAKTPLDLSGTLAGEGMAVSGRLGPLALDGAWDDLRLELDPIELVVGSVRGAGRWTNRFTARLDYTSPYLNLPVDVLQEGARWRFVAGGYGEGVWEDGRFRAAIENLPIEVAGGVSLSGEAMWTPESGWSGAQRWTGRYVSARSRLEGEALAFDGVAEVGRVRLPFGGVADAAGVRGRLDGARFVLAPGDYRLDGRVRLADYGRYQGALAWDGARWSGEAALEGLGTTVRLEGDGPLHLTASGYLEAAGTLWPQVRVGGTLRLPSWRGLAVAPLELDWRGRELRLGKGHLRLEAPYPFTLELPLEGYGYSGRIVVAGDRDGGSLAAELPWGRLEGEGPWRALALGGALELPRLGRVALSGDADLTALRYRTLWTLPDLEGSLSLAGTGADYTARGALQQEKLRLTGDGRGWRLEARGFDSGVLGLPGSWQGSLDLGELWRGDLAYAGPWGSWSARGFGSLKLTGEGPGYRAEGYVNPDRAFLRTDLTVDWAAGTLTLEGPWSGLEAVGEGVWRPPGLKEVPWTFAASLNGLRWHLGGPLELDGAGLSYSGSLRWDDALLGRELALRAELEGEGLDLQVRGQARLADYAVDAEVRHAGGLWSGRWRTPEGAVVLDGRQLRVERLGLGALAAAFGVEADGWLGGRIDLAERTGSLAGSLEAYGIRTGLLVRPEARGWRFEAYRADAGWGLRLRAQEGWWLEGLGGVSGRLRLDGPREGRLVYRSEGVYAWAEGDGAVLTGGFEGWGERVRALWDRDRLRLDWEGAASGRVEASLAERSYQGFARWRGKAGDAYLAFSGRDLRWQGQGFGVLYQGLPQAGPLVAQGDGSSWRVFWGAPVQLELAGAGARLERLRLEGAGDVGTAQRGFGRVLADLRLEEGAFAGALEVSGDGRMLQAVGEGKRLALSGDLWGYGLRGRIGADGALELKLAGTRSLGPASLALDGFASGRLLEPRLRLDGTLKGRDDAEVQMRFTYDRSWTLTANGPGLHAQLEPARAEVALTDFDLAPFTGLPVRVSAEGAGPPAELELPLELRGERVRLSGRARPFAAEVHLAGELLDGRAELDWAAGSGRLALDLPDPRVVGEVRYAEGRWLGGFNFDLQTGGGGFSGRLDAGRGELSLAGYGANEGRMLLRFDPFRLEGRLAGAGWRTEADMLRLAGGGWVGSFRFDSERWGGMAGVGEGERIRLEGRGGLAPFEGVITTRPWGLDWSYAGPLPGGLGELDAVGRWPGEVWLEGTWTVRGTQLALEGRGSALRVSGEGLAAELSASGVRTRLDGFRMAGMVWNGVLEGPWRDLRVDLAAAGLRARGRLARDWNLKLEGWARGVLDRRSGAWGGRVEALGATLEAQGSDPWPELVGRWRGHDVRLAYPELRLDGLRVDLARRRAEGAAEVAGMRWVGAGERLEARYPVEGGELRAALDLPDWRVRLFAEGLGEGVLTFQPAAGFSGSLILDTKAGRAVLRGEGGRLRLAWTHPATDWLPWGEGRLEGWFDTAGSWSAVYRGGEVRLEAEGQGARAAFTLASPWGGGTLRYAEGWTGSLELAGWPVPPLEASLSSRLEADAGGLAWSGELAGEAGRMSYSLRADASRWVPKVDTAAWVVENMRLEALPKMLRVLPYASGRVNGTLTYGRGRWAGRIVSDEVRVGEETHPVEAALYWSDALRSLELNLDQSRIEASLEAGELRITGDLVRLPLHYLTGAWAGPLEGVGYWTGAVKARLPGRDWRRGYLVLVGERLEFSGAGKTLAGSAVVRYERQTLHLDRLDLSGDGRIQGEGWWSPEDADLRVEVEDTDLTPILNVVPQWRPYEPGLAGSFSLRVEGARTVFEARDLDWGVSSVAGRIPQLHFERDARGSRLEGRTEVTAPYSASFDLTGDGTAEAFDLRFDGRAELPFVGTLEQVGGTLRLPEGRLDLRADDARLEGLVWPTALRLTGELDVAEPDYYLQSGRVRTDLRLDYVDGGFTLGGETEVLRAVLSRPENRREVVFEDRRYRYPLRFDQVRIYSNGGLLIQEPLAQGEGAGEVYLGGTLEDPYLSGEVRGLRGEFVLGRHRFVVDEAWARFSPAMGLYPEIYLRAHARLRTPDGEADLVLESDGRFVREAGRARLVLDPRLWAEADGQVLPYSQEELLAMLALGSNTTVAEGVASLAIQNLLISQLEYELARALGLDIFTFDTELFSGGEASTTQFTIGKYLSPELFVTYSLDLGGRQALGAEYRVDGLRLRVESELGGDLLEPQVRFSLLYAIRPDLDLILNLRTGEMRLGLEWRF
ncbi:translocation/assembly module TamB domain-containing protein [Oceanithermus sp.]